MSGRSPEGVAEASAWAEYERAMWARGLEYYRARLRGLGVSPGRVLDLGCGPGQWAAAAAAEGHYVVAYDRRPGMASRRFSGGGAIHLTAGEASRLPFEDDSFDLVLCNLVLPYVPLEACTAEIARVLRPAGSLFGICHGPGYYVLQGARELRRSPRGAVRRLIVLGYTLAHNTFRLQRYHYETFQTPPRLNRVLGDCGLRTCWTRAGGHPLMPERTLLGMMVFFEFLACRVEAPSRSPGATCRV